MQIYTYSEDCQKLAVVLEQAEYTVKVLIREKGRRTDALMPEKPAISPLNVPLINATITTTEIADMADGTSACV
ncbi:MAG: type II toxin-antitoxin system Phd/YefM family antitoxin [Desulfofustis sp. PB-SRB1]|jgi:hypothetical protein|nr:type II toxin-antitoxin system Phd/YefM family antitoxin [Desulfofustis sp. PB-SRB1]MBM1002867.1 type II toxin-antitoxin system Phd/YefM family antitoxin [Desulfofustis sp. PB-SRB1]HBH28490.1 prevent-host-death protein [Desulfofustis sp.]HBH30490.1 prevent-host-death protein [Desulfofustis sp.]